MAAFAADVPVMLARIANELDLTIAALRARVAIEFSPRGIAGFADTSRRRSAVTDVWITTDAPGAIGDEGAIPAALPSTTCSATAAAT